MYVHIYVPLLCAVQYEQDIIDAGAARNGDLQGAFHAKVDQWLLEVRFTYTES
jgi:hypothetical protein